MNKYIITARYGKSKRGAELIRDAIEITPSGIHMYDLDSKGYRENVVGFSSSSIKTMTSISIKVRRGGSND